MDNNSIASLLLTPNAFASLTIDDAQRVVSSMQLRRYPADTIIFTFNSQSDEMLLVLCGDVVVEAQTTGDGSVIVGVLGAGHIIGEMGLIDGEPRSAQCTTKTEVDVAILTRKAVETLINDFPQTAARFMLALTKRIADRLRVANHKLMVMNQVNSALQQELESPATKLRPKK